MNTLNSNKVGLVLGIVVGGLHLLWSLLIALGLAQPLLDFIFKLHMIKPVIVVDSFNVGLALALVVVTAVIGYIVGYIFASVWKYLHK